MQMIASAAAVQVGNISLLNLLALVLPFLMLELYVSVFSVLEFKQQSGVHGGKSYTELELKTTPFNTRQQQNGPAFSDNANSTAV